MQPASKPPKRPVSVLVLLHDGAGHVLLLERADRAGFWQSVTGIVLVESSLHDWRRSVVYEIYAHWRHRYVDGVTHNTEHWFSARIDRSTPIRLSEHTAYAWQPALLAAEQVFSPSNREIIEEWHRMQAQR